MKKILAFAFAAFMLSSCGSQKSLYSWYDYNDVNYEYNKTPNEKTLAKLTKQYEKIASKVREKSCHPVSMQSTAISLSKQERKNRD